MSQIIIVVDRPEKWPFNIEGVETVAARSYLTEERFSSMKGVRIYNACRSYTYQSTGYYVSLLAEARGHKPLPSVATVQDTKFQSLFKSVSSELDELIHKSLAHLHGERFELSIYFSHNTAKHYDRLCRALYFLFPSPFIRAHFAKDEEGWSLKNISLISSSEISQEHRGVIPELARKYFEKKRPGPARRKPPRYTIAIMAGKEDPTPPSDEDALKRFEKAAARFSMATEIIDRDDYGRLAEFDGLFIRQTTAVNDITYRMARKAEAEGLVVIDDPASIIKCTNKVFLAELMSRHGVNSPATWIAHRDNVDELVSAMTFPVIVKQPDSSFSLGVHKAKDAEEFKHMSHQLLENSELLIVQEFLKTEYDWRIGIIEGRPLYACKYFMARGHWQIYDHSKNKEKETYWGKWETIPVELAPHRVVKTAEKAARLIGNGFYGVDLKEMDGKCYVIEVNDNPSVDHGVEDVILKDALYERVMEVFSRRLDASRGWQPVL
jgi:glutathione synthase/RimK-type ligase-like ATP-grasp enzyme